jgi:hypothetical protein
MNAASLQRRALLLSYLTVGYNVLEGAVSLVAGALAGSMALVGFGLDSFVESLSGGVMIWRCTKRKVKGWALAHLFSMLCEPLCTLCLCG